MRLNKIELEAIKECFINIFNNGRIYLFGSRVDDTKKGGDIDLFIDVEQRKNLIEKKIRFLVLLKQKIGEQKIDIVFNTNSDLLIEKKAIEKGILLWKS